MKVAIAMSGGVDSSVAAALLLKEGYQVVGLTMALADPDSKMGACSDPRTIADAKAVAEGLGIEHQVVDLRAAFSEAVIADFCSQYQRGCTPNPCIRCNEKIKFGALLSTAQELGADFLATGHYVRIEHNDRHLLYRARDRQKDQSYFLAGLKQEQLRHLLFPLGELTKAETRSLAQELGLVVAEKAESQEICFIADDYRTFLQGMIEEKPGLVVDEEGKVLREHSGISNFTIGQRRNLGLGNTGQRYFVLRIEPEEGKVVVGPREGLAQRELWAQEPNFLPFDKLEGPLEVTAQIRYRTAASPALIEPDEEGIRVRFVHPQQAITPGQTVVFYQEELVVGSSTIVAVTG